MSTQINTRPSGRVKPVFIKASEVKALTIWDNRRKMERARLAGNLQLIKKDGQNFYNLNSIDPRFLKHPL